MPEAIFGHFENFVAEDLIVGPCGQIRLSLWQSRLQAWHPLRL